MMTMPWFKGLPAITLTFLLFPSLPALADLIRVPGEQPTIQAGIDAAEDGDTVLVADGVYTGPGNHDIDLLGKAISVVSVNGPENCIIDVDTSTDLHRGIHIHQGEGRDTVIEGFTIQGADSRGDGGGILIEGRESYANAPVIRGNIIQDCFTQYGGGIACINGARPLIEDNIIRLNWAIDAGGGIYTENSSPVIRGNLILDNQAGYYTWAGWAGGIYCDEHTLVENNVIRGNVAFSDWYHVKGVAGGIWARDSAVIAGNLVVNNGAADGADGIYCLGTTLVTGNIVASGYTTDYTDEYQALVAAGGYSAYHGSLIYSEATITDNIISNGVDMGLLAVGDCLLANNLVTGSGDIGICCFGNPTLSSCTVAGSGSAGVYLGAGGSLTVIDSIIWGNDPTDGVQIAINGDDVDPSMLNIQHCNVQGGEAAGVDLGENPGAVTLVWGPGMIDADPLFATAGDDGYFLGQTAAGQPANSPCLDTGSDAASAKYFPVASGVRFMGTLTTRTDRQPDLGILDMGYHYTPPSLGPDTLITGGPDGVVDSPVLNFSFIGSDDVDPPSALTYAHRIDEDQWSAYGSATIATLVDLGEGAHSFAVRARDSEGNVDPTPAERYFVIQNWEPSPDWAHLVTGPGPGPLNPPLVRTDLAEWVAYGVMTYGVNVAAGDLDGDGTDEVITGAGPGPPFGPHVRCFEPDGQVIDGAGFLAYGTNKYGVNVAAGDIDGDGKDEIITGAGPGPVFGPHVRAWNHDGGPGSTPIPEVSFFAYGTPKWGVNVSCGDIDGDGIDEIVTGAGPGPVYGPHVRGWNWDGSGAVSSIPEVSFLAYGTHKYGVNVACGDLDGDGFDEIVTGAGPSSVFGAHVRGWDWDGHGKVEPMAHINFMAYGTYRYGAVVAAGDLNGDTRDDLLIMPGPGPGNLVDLRAWQLVGNQLELLLQLRAYDEWILFGGRVAVGNF